MRVGEGICMGTHHDTVFLLKLQHKLNSRVLPMQFLEANIYVIFKLYACILFLFVNSHMAFSTSATGEGEDFFCVAGYDFRGKGGKTLIDQE